MKPGAAPGAESLPAQIERLEVLIVLWFSIRLDYASASGTEPDMSLPTNILIFDTTLRDGEQSPGCTMHAGEKLRMAHQLATLGVDVLEAGFPIASEGDFESVRAIARELRGPRIAALARAKREDIEAAARAIEPAAVNRIHTFLSSSDIHLQHQMHISRAEALEQAGEAVRLSRSFVDDVEFSPMDATRSDPAFPARDGDGRGAGGRDDHQYTGHGRIFHARRVQGDLSHAEDRGAGQRCHNVFDALP